MSEENILVKEVELNVGLKNLNRIKIPAYITDNVKYSLFDWQKSALQHFLAYENPDNDLYTTS